MYITLDLETLARPISEEALEARKMALEEQFIRPLSVITDRVHAKYVKDDTRKKHIRQECEKDEEKYEEALQSWCDGWKFTRRGVQILCVGIGIFEDCELVESYCNPGPIEADVLSGAFKFLETAAERHNFPYWPEIFTFNGDSFDWLHFERACIQNRVFPAVPFGVRSLTDLMKYPFERYAPSESLDSLCDLYGGVEVPEQFLVEDFPSPNGSMVAEMWELDQKDSEGRVERYCLQDIYKTGMIAGLRRRLWSK